MRSRFRRIERATRGPPRRKRRRVRGDERPAGPNLVPGRGLARRRPRFALLHWLPYLLLAAAVTVWLARHYLTPHIS